MKDFILIKEEESEIIVVDLEGIEEDIDGSKEIT